VQTRVHAAVHGPGADDVVQEVFLRLWRELSSGKTYPVSFRVVVHQVTTWTIKEHFRDGRGGELAVGDGQELVGDVPLDPPDDSGFDALLEGLTQKQREVVRLRYLEGLEIDEIAARLGMKRNAIDQALHRALGRLRGAVLDG
jgi:RNA polymerase sigma factor (sigma-70 family)